MRTITYTILSLLVSWVCLAQVEIYDFSGSVLIKDNRISQLQGNKLSLDWTFDLCGLSVGRYETLSIIPMLQSGQDSLLLQPIVINGANKQKMYQRTLAFHGKEVADAGAYVVLSNESDLMRRFFYRKDIPYAPWMKGCKFVLVGILKDYDGNVIQRFTDVLTEDFKVEEAGL